MGAALNPALAQDPTKPTNNGLRSVEGTAALPKTAKTAHYRIRARYDETKQRIEGQLLLRWTNQQPRPASRIALRTYMNAFSHTAHPWMRETGSHFRGIPIDTQALGYLHIKTVNIDQAPQGPNQWPQANLEENPGVLSVSEKDPSLVWLNLPRDVGSGQSVELNIEFETQLPPVFARTGYAPGFVMAAQWYPKPSVYTKQGWSTPAFSHNAEFFSDFADYDVALDLPEGWSLVGTGEMVAPASGLESSPGRRWHQRSATMVHDFAWSAMREGRLQSVQLQDIEVQGLLPASSHPRDDRHLALQTELLRVMQARYGPYPWRSLSFVLPPDSAKGAQGMEYPTFYATGPYARHQFSPRLYTNLYDGAWTTIHEFGHQYFQSLVASDEATDPWLDEGLNTLTDAILFADLFGQDTGVYSYLGYPITPLTLLREVLYGDPINAPIAQSAASFGTHPGNYGATVYARCALVFLTLRALCNEGSFDRALRDYVKRFAFGHPSSTQARDFFAQALHKQCPNHPESDSINIKEYFASTLDLPFDFDVSGKLWYPESRLPAGGWVQDRLGPSARPQWQASDSSSPPSYRQFFVLNRKGALAVPVEYEIQYADQRRLRRVWPADGRTLLRVEHQFQRPDQKIQRIHIDPEQKLKLESRKLNNMVALPTAPVSAQERRISQAPLSWLRAAQVLIGNLLP